MALVVGTDTYISQTDATAYVTANYATTDTAYIAWNALSTANKDARLRKATQTIDRQPLKGSKAVYTQVLAFPRRVREYDPSLQLFLEEIVTPDAVKNAQVELALEIMQGPNERAELQRQGVKSFSVGNLSENYGSGRKMALSYEVSELLKPYLATTVRIS